MVFVNASKLGSRSEHTHHALGFAGGLEFHSDPGSHAFAGLEPPAGHEKAIGDRGRQDPATARRGRQRPLGVDTDRPWVDGSHSWMGL